MKLKQKDKKLILFVIKFFIIFVVLSTLIEIANLIFINNFLAHISSSYLGLIATGNIITVNNIDFVVTNYCTGLVSASILASIIFALNKPRLINKIILFVLGALVLFVINILRIQLVLVGATMGVDPELVHIITWFLMSGLVLLLWYYGSKKLFGYKDLSYLL